MHSQRRIERVHAIREMARPPRIALHRLQNYPIVETLGLKVKHTQSGSSVVDYLEPVRPFWLRASVSEDLGRVVATADPAFEPEAPDDPQRRWRFHEWAPKPPDAPRWPPVVAPPSYFEGGGATAIGARLVEALSEGERKDLPARVQSLSRRMLAKELQALRRAAAALSRAEKAKAEADWPPDLAHAAQTPEALAAFVAAEPRKRLRACAEAMRAALPAWRPPPSRRARVTELARLGSLALRIEKEGRGEAGLAGIADEAMRERCARLLRIFSAPERETDADLRGADARSLYETYVALAQERSEPPEALAGLPAAPSALIGLLKRVERWIVEPADFSGDWRVCVPQPTERAADRLRLSRFVAEYDFDAERLALLEAAFDAGALETLRSLAEMSEQGPLREALRRHEGTALDPTTMLTLAADALAGDVKDWAEPARWLRMTRAEAKQAVAELEDLQSVFAAILDDGWDGEGPPRAGP